MERVATERAVLANITTAVLLFNSDLQVIFLNSAAEMILELSARKAIGRKAKDLFLYAPDLEQRLQSVEPLPLQL